MYVLQRGAEGSFLCLQHVNVINVFNPFKYEAQTALFKYPFRTAQ